MCPRSGVAMGVGVVCESERTGKTEAKTRVEWSILKASQRSEMRLLTTAVAGSQGLKHGAAT